MKQRIPDGDPVLALDDAEHKTLCAFCVEYAKRTDLPHATLETHAPLAALLCYLRDKPAPADYTGKVITWTSPDGRISVADCLGHDNSHCHTALGLVHVSRVAEHLPDTRLALNWPPGPRA